MKFDVARAWKDAEYRQSLSEEELLSLPENPVGELELTDADLEAVYGGASFFYCSFDCFNSAYGFCISNGFCETFGYYCRFK
jgi:mersacidin/lichenicidin family type 2 lantibiotic